MDAHVSLSTDSAEQDSKSLEQYQELVGCLLYRTSCTGPDLAQA